MMSDYEYGRDQSLYSRDTCEHGTPITYDGQVIACPYCISDACVELDALEDEQNAREHEIRKAATALAVTAVEFNELWRTDGDIVADVAHDTYLSLTPAQCRIAVEAYDKRLADFGITRT